MKQVPPCIQLETTGERERERKKNQKSPWTQVHHSPLAHVFEYTAPAVETMRPVQATRKQQSIDCNKMDMDTKEDVLSHDESENDEEEPATSSSSEDEESNEGEDDDSDSYDGASVDSSHEFHLHEISDDEKDDDDDESNKHIEDEVNQENTVDMTVADSEEEEEEEVHKLPGKVAVAVEEVTHFADPKTIGTTVAQIDEYEYDSSDEEDLRNTIGNIPVEWYNQYDHIGYDHFGKKIIKPKDPNENEVDHFLNKLEDPYYWRTVKDKFTGENVVLTDKDVDLVQRMKKGVYPDSNYEPYPEFIDFFTYEKMIHPVTNRPERKASFIPSISEKRAVSKLVTQIKREWQKPKIESKPKDSKYNFNYDVWEKEIENESKRQEDRRRKYIPAPKMRLPGHQESYNPPPEYLPSDYDESKGLKQVPSGYVPHKFPNLRSVPFYNNFVKERFERCLDLYLCPRVTKMKSQVNPEDLIPKLPRPKDLQPFPTVETIVFKGHNDTVNSVSFEPLGEFFASASDDNCVFIWETLTGRCFKKFTFDSNVNAISWNPNSSLPMLAVAAGKDVIIIIPSICDKLATSSLEEYLNSLKSIEPSDTPVSTWKFYDETDGPWNLGHRIIINHKFDVKQLNWHYKGDYLSVVCPSGANRSVVIHQISKKRSQLPFSKSHGQIVCSLFHPNRPFFFVATKQFVRIYDLVKQELSKKLSANCKLISSMSIHPKGKLIIIATTITTTTTETRKFFSRKNILNLIFYTLLNN